MNKFKYFKVSDLLLDTDIKKSELWVYLTHCRATGSTKGKGNSYAGLNAVQKHFGNKIDKKVYDKCIKSLVSKGLINLVDIEENKIFTGFYKSDTGVEVIKGKTNIQIPVELLDKKIITNSSIEKIKDIISLYSLYDPLGSYGGLDYNIISAINKDTNNGAKLVATFGGGFNRVIHNKKAYKIEYPTKYIFDTDFKIDINKYIDMKLFKLKPVILEYDIDDEDLTELKGEVFQDLVGFSNDDNNYEYMTILKDNQKVIWVLEPIYPIKNEPYKEYIKHRAAARERAIEIYSNTDKSTQENILKRFIYSYDLFYYVEDELVNRKGIEVDTILELLNYIQDHNYNIDTIDELSEEINLIDYEITKEKQSIEDDNIRITIEENRDRPRRHTTSPRLKDLQSNYYKLQREIENIKRIENKLIDLIPKWIIDQLLDLIELDLLREY